MSLQMDKMKKLGAGTYGIVYSAQKDSFSIPGNIKGEEIAVKRNLKELGVDFISSLKEMDILIKIKGHPYLVELLYVSFGNPFKNKTSPVKYEVDTKDDEVHFIFEKADFDFHQFIYHQVIREPSTQKDGYLMWKDAMMQILLGMEFLHSQHIIHRDMKPSNILCFIEDNVLRFKICDFGLSKIYSEQGPQTPGSVTAWYRAPEICLEYNYDYRCDVWSLGAIFYELITAKALFKVHKPNLEALDIIKNIINTIPQKLKDEDFKNTRFEHKIDWKNMRKKRIQKPKEEKKEEKKTKERRSWKVILGANDEFEKVFGIESYNQFVDLLGKMLIYDYRSRYTVSECLNHPFFDFCKDKIAGQRAKFPPILHQKPE